MHIHKKSFLIAFASMLGTAALAQPKPSSMDDPFVLLMFIVICVLALVIGLLAYVVIGAAGLRSANEKKETGKPPVGALLLALFFSFAGLPLMAQDGKPSTVNTLVSNPDAYYSLAAVLFLELAVIVALLLILRSLIRAEVVKTVPAAEAGAVADPKEKLDWWDNLNRFRPLAQEADIDMGHEYDGIRELDNRLPPWWIYGFYLCILFAVVYLWRFHVDGSAPLSHEEYEMAMTDAEAAKSAYLEKAANNVDENTVKLIKDADALAPAGKIFETTCAACHGKKGEGGVGPNLTDDYWLHGGDVKDVFKTVKYGWPEKGMKSWKDDYSPTQIAQLASYVVLLRGTDPPNPKAPQGTLYQQRAAAPAADSTAKPAAAPAPKS